MNYLEQTKIELELLRKLSSQLYKDNSLPKLKVNEKRLKLHKITNRPASSHLEFFNYYSVVVGFCRVQRNTENIIQLLKHKLFHFQDVQAHNFNVVSKNHNE